MHGKGGPRKKHSETAGGTRRYSLDDVERPRRIGELLTAGLNVAGIVRVLRVEGENSDLRTAPRGPRPKP